MKTERPGPSTRVALRFARLLVSLLLAFGNIMSAPMVTVASTIAEPTPAETVTPTEAPAETATPTDVPAETATPADTATPTEAPADTATPTDEPTATPTDAPTETATPTDEPTATATATATPTGPMSSLIVRMVSGLTADQQQAVIARNGGTETDAIPALRMHFVDAPSATINDTIANYRADSQVVSVELDKVREVGGTPSDPKYADQWALPKIGWDSVYGSVSPSGSSVLAVLDTGVDASHPDLSGRVLPGFSIFAGGDPQSDPNGHGTWMAGIAAARTDNGAGIAGVAYGGVKVIPVQVLGADGTGQDSDIIEGVVWATDNGADVILMAFSNPGYSPALQAAIDYAWDHGVVLVAATGNDGSSTATFPAGDRGVIGVSATNQNDALAGSSNYGQDVFLAAPGVGIVATDNGGGYTSVNGTSASAAIVAGAAALLRADSGASNGVIVGRLARNADPAGSQGETGNGRINLARAMADTDSSSVKPAGASPVGSGGPYVGPYVVASQEDYKHYADKPPAAWQNGALQSTNSQYFEGEVVPHYWTSAKLTVGATYAFNIYYDYFDGSNPTNKFCGFDYLAQYNTSRTPPAIGSAPTADDPLPQGFGNFYTVGANITSVSAPVTTGVQRYVQVKFVATAATTDFYWGLHLAFPGAVAGPPACGGARSWPGASLQSDVRDTPTVAGATMLGGGGSMQINPSAIIQGSISGFKWSDLNGNGVSDTGEPKLSGWTIQLCSDSACANVLQTATTDSSGNYSFNVTPGTYYVREVLQSGWRQTAPASGVYGPLTVSATTPTYSNQNFGNQQLGKLVINKTANGGNDTFSFTTTGTGLSNFTITTSGGSGSQTFNNLVPGAKTVTEGTLPT